MLFAMMELGVLLLTSCAQGQAHLTVHRDGTADLAVGASVGRQTLSAIGQPDLPQKLADALRKNGLDATVEENGRQAGVQANRHLNLREMDEEKPELPEGLQVEQTRERKFFYTRYHAVVTADMDRLLSSSGGEWSRKLDSLPTLAKNLVQSQIKLDFLLTLPIKPGANNADETQDGGRTLVWHLSLFGTNRLEASFAAPDIGRIALAGVPSLLLLAAAVGYAFVRLRKRRRGAD